MNSRLLPFLLLTLMFAAACSRGPAEASVRAAGTKPAPLAVTVATAENRKLERTISVTGSLVADESVTVSPEVSGRVLSIAADFGQSVRKGEVIAEIDPTEYRIQLERSRAALNQALARLGLQPGEETKPPENTPAIRQATAQMEDARFKFESAAQLVNTGDISRERYTELEKAFRGRQAAVEATRDELRTQMAVHPAVAGGSETRRKTFVGRDDTRTVRRRGDCAVGVTWAVYEREHADFHAGEFEPAALARGDSGRAVGRCRWVHHSRLLPMRRPTGAFTRWCGS